jgi:thiamine-monophosphate kinase
VTSEFDLINRYFRRATPGALLGVGDDGAIVQPKPGNELVISTDMLVAGTHFFPDTDPQDLGWKVLAVNLSDLAAMGALPRWVLLALALPAADEDWIAAFARGFFSCAETHGVELIGGDTTRGPMNFCVTVFGEAPTGEALRRSDAQAGDDIWVSGQPGRAGLGLASLQGRCVLDAPAQAECVGALLHPLPRVRLGLALRGLATAAVDVSDGLLADLGHILEASKLSASLTLESLPTCNAFATVDADLVQDCMLSGGDDYELLFTAPINLRPRVEALADTLQLALARIGSTAPKGYKTLRLIDAKGAEVQPTRLGYDHFS